MLDAVRQIKIHGNSIPSVAKSHNINYRTLLRYCKKFTDRELRNDTEHPPSTHVGYSQSKRVFTDQTEQALQTYILTAARIRYGITSKEIRNLAYSLAVSEDLPTPDSWKANNAAGEDWFHSYVKRYPPVAKVLVSATAKTDTSTNVTSFFDCLAEQHDFLPDAVWSVDEMAVVAPAPAADTENPRETVTLVCAASAAGNSIPPVFIFPRALYRERFLNDGPAGSVGAANHEGRMDEKLFWQYIRHFVRHTGCTVQNPRLILLGSYREFCVSVEGLDYCSENGIVLLAIPPHYSQTMQPLHRAVFGPLSRCYRKECEIWRRDNPDGRVTIYEVPAFIGKAYTSLGALSQSIRKSFQASGICPFNRVSLIESFLLSDSGGR